MLASAAVDFFDAYQIGLIGFHQDDIVALCAPDGIEAGPSIENVQPGTAAHLEDVISATADQYIIAVFAIKYVVFVRACQRVVAIGSDENMAVYNRLWDYRE